MKTSSNKPRQGFQVRNEQKKKFKKKPQEEQSKGLNVSVQGDDINKALRIFKKKVLNDGRLNDFHERQFHTKKSEKNRLAKASGRQRWLRKLAETPGPHQPRKRTNNRKRTP
jgi:ribosomal protein S21